MNGIYAYGPMMPGEPRENGSGVMPEYARCASTSPSPSPSWTSIPRRLNRFSPTETPNSSREYEKASSGYGNQRVRPVAPSMSCTNAVEPRGEREMPGMKANTAPRSAVTCLKYQPSK